MQIDDAKTRNRILTVLFVGVLMGALDIAVVGPALPAIQRFFSVGDRSLSWVFSMYVLFFLVGTPLMTKLADRRSRREIYVLDVLLFGVGSLAVALSPRFEVLLAGRAIQGFGAGGIFPVVSAVVGDTFPEEKRGGALGLIGAVFGLAFIIGPVFGGLLLRFGWQWLFLINLPVTAAVAVLGLRVLPGQRGSERAAFDWAGMVVLAAALASPVAGRLLDHIGAKPVIISGTLLLTAGLSLLGFSAGSLALFITAGVIIGLGLSSLLGAPLRYIMFQEAGPQDRSAAQGVLAVNTSVGQLIGASAVSAVAASLGGGVSGYGRSYLVIAALSFVLFAAAWWLKGKGERKVSKTSGLDAPGSLRCIF